MQSPLSIIPSTQPDTITNSPVNPVRTIIVGYAPDETGTRAFHTAMALASCFSAKLIALRSIQRPTWGVVDVSYGMLAEDLLQEEKERMVKGAERVVSHSNVDCIFKVTFDGPVDFVLHEVESENADLVVLGSHGTEGLEALLLGSVSRSVGLLCSCPVLVLPPQCLRGVPISDSDDVLGPGPVLFASDLRYNGIRAAEYAQAMAKQLSRPLIAMHVLPQETQSISPETAVWEEDFAKEQIRILFGEGPKGQSAQIVVGHGNSAEEILAEATRQRAALILVGGGVHIAGVDHAPWEAVACILRSATCPVLIVPANSK